MRIALTEVSQKGHSERNKNTRMWCYLNIYGYMDTKALIQNKNSKCSAVIPMECVYEYTFNHVCYFMMLDILLFKMWKFQCYQQISPLVRSLIWQRVRSTCEMVYLFLYI